MCLRSSLALSPTTSVLRDTTTSLESAKKSQSRSMSPTPNISQQTMSGAIQNLDTFGRLQGTTISLRPIPACTQSSIGRRDRKSTRLNSSHVSISYAVFCLKKKKSMIDGFISEHVEEDAQYRTCHVRS